MTPAKAVPWWRRLQPDMPTGDRGALARLRRCATVSEAMTNETAFALFRAVEAEGASDLPKVALLAVVLAHVREDRPGASVARLLGPERPDAPETALMSPLRFSRLLAADTPDERLTAFRRMVVLAGGALPVADLCFSLLGWSEWRRRQWTYAYWDAGRPSGDAPNETEETPA